MLVDESSMIPTPDLADLAEAHLYLGVVSGGMQTARMGGARHGVRPGGPGLRVTSEYRRNPNATHLRARM